MSHAPKQCALEAYAAERLSPAGRRRMEAHLARCAECQAYLTATRAYARLREQAGAAPAPAPSWERLERALAAPPQTSAPRRSGRVIALAWPVLAVAATVMIGWLALSNAPEAAPAPRLAERAPVPQPEPSVTGRVTLLAGTARLERADPSETIDLRSEIREGSLLITEHDAELHVALEPETGFVLGPDSRLRVLELRPQRTRLELLAGSVASRVRKLDEALTAYYRVLSADIAASVRGTRFTVEQTRGIRVSVHEGLVEVARGDEILALLSAGQSYETPTRGAAGARDATVHELERAFHALSALHLPPLPQLRNWRIDGAVLSAQGQLSMRMPRGSAQLTFEDMRGQVRSVEIEVNEDDTRIDPLWLAKQVAPKEAPRTGHLEPEQIAEVIKAGLDPLRRCYERSLRTIPGLQAKLTLSVRVGPDGRVQRAQANSAAGELPEELERCIASEAGRLIFPKPDGGGGVSFEVPLNLKSK